jgi:hypothetical protein
MMRSKVRASRQAAREKYENKLEEWAQRPYKEGGHNRPLQSITTNEI